MINFKFTNKFQSSILKQNRLSIDSFCNLLKIVSFAFLFLILPANNVSAATLSKPANNLGLVGYWAFNDATSTSATDFSGNGNTGTLTNMSNPGTATSGWGSGKLGGGLNFDGTDDYVNIPDTDALDLTGDFTLSFFVKPGTSNALYYGVLDKMPGSTGWAVLYSSSNVLSLWINNASRVQTTAIINSNTWTHVTFVKTSTQTQVFVNGVLNATGTTANPTATANSLYVGRYYSSAYSSIGKIDDVRIYNRALSATEITSLYSTGSQKLKIGASNNGLVGYWSFDDATGTKATDFSGNGKHGVTIALSNPPTATSGWGAGKFGGGINFDATKFDGVSVSNATPLGSAFTFSMWVKPTSLSTNQVFAGTFASNGWLLRNSAYTNKRLEFYNGATNYTSSNTTLTTGVWQLITVTYDGSYYKFYYNGTLDYTSSPGQGAPNSESTLYISRLLGGYGVNGAIDEVRQYSRALSAAEIAGLYTSGAQKINASRNVTGSSLDSGLVGLWSFDGKDMNGTTAYDRSGQGNNGTLTNGPTKTIGKLGQALSFDGTDDYVDTGNMTQVNGATVLTVSAWVKRNSNSTYGAIFEKYNGAASWLSYMFHNSGYMYFIPSDITSSYGTMAQPLGTEWKHFVTVFDGTQAGNANRLKVYINGVQQSLAFVGTIGSTLASSASTAKIGRDTHNSTYINGSIDDVRIYNRALSASEVTALYNLGK